MAGKFIRVNGVKVQVNPRQVVSGKLKSVGRFRVGGVTMVACECLCGSFCVAVEENVRSGNTKSCGCLKQIYDVDSRGFDAIDSELKAWVLGFIMADGCVTDSVLSVVVAAKDIDALEKVRMALGSNSPIKVSKGSGHSPNGLYARLTICSVPLVRCLAKYGICRRKSLTVVPPQIAEDMEPHFWRGAVDGDGWVMTRVGLKHNGSGVGICGSKATVEAFAEFVNRKCGFLPSVRQCGKIWRTSVETHCRAYWIAKLLYENCSVVLNRKAELARIVLSRSAEHWSYMGRWLTVDGKRVRLKDAVSVSGVSSGRILNRLAAGWSETDAVKTVSTRGRVLITAHGKTQWVAQWSRELGIKRTTIEERLKRGDSHERALRKC